MPPCGLISGPGNRVQRFRGPVDPDQDRFLHADLRLPPYYPSRDRSACFHPHTVRPGGTVPKVADSTVVLPRHPRHQGLITQALRHYRKRCCESHSGGQRAMGADYPVHGTT